MGFDLDNHFIICNGHGFARRAVWAASNTRPESTPILINAGCDNAVLDLGGSTPKIPSKGQVILFATLTTAMTFPMQGAQRKVPRALTELSEISCAVTAAGLKATLSRISRERGAYLMTPMSHASNQGYWRIGLLASTGCVNSHGRPALQYNIRFGPQAPIIPDSRRYGSPSRPACTIAVKPRT